MKLLPALVLLRRSRVPFYPPDHLGANTSVIEPVPFFQAANTSRIVSRLVSVWLPIAVVTARSFHGRGDTEQRRAMLTESVQEYDIADVRPVFGKDAE
jgi:hypothetical protein